MSTSPTRHDPSIAECDECPLAPDRRAFLRDAALAVAAALVAAGSTVRAAAAAPLMFTAPTRSRGTTHSYELPAADGATIDRRNEVILTRWQGRVYAFALSCPHQNTALRWLPADARFQCPRHKSKYRPDGTFIEGRATRGMDRFSIRHEGAGITVDLDALHKQTDNPQEWASAFVAV